MEWWSPVSGAGDRQWLVESYVQRIARLADVDDVSIHHLDDGELVLVEILAPARTGLDLADLSRGPLEARSPTAGLVTTRGDALVVRSEATVGGRAVLTLSLLHEVARADLLVTLRDAVVPALSVAPGVRGVRAHLADTRHGGSVLGDLVVVVAARDVASAVDALDAVTESTGLAQMATELRTRPVLSTQIVREDGRPLLPQRGPVAKPSLDPRPRRPDARPEVGTPRRLRSARVIRVPGGFAEDVVVDGAGQLLCGVDGGAILRIDPTTFAVETLASTGGRPLGLEHREDDTLLICDAHCGLLRLDLSTGELVTLTRFVDSRPLRFCSNATTLPDGTIWFTESTTRFDFEHHRGSMMENRPSGRLLRRTPDGIVTVIRDDLWFANGVTRTPDADALLVVETAALRVNRMALSGPRAGAFDAVTAGLPGYPDNMSAFREGRAWIPLTNPRMAALDMLGTAPRLLSHLAWRMPERLRPEPDHTVWAVAVDPNGDIVDEVHGTHPDFHTATGAVEVDGTLFIASVFTEAMLAIDLTGSR
ncbi:SMP-30/Gluconolaconase/LRE-like region-containing protein [Williamsia deligens]|nr:SMP-30/Gluconolaconase/LRE-like region-containing protein [Williamsia deligens]